MPSLRGDRGMLVYTGQNRYRFLLTLIFILLFLLILAPSVNLSVDTLAKGKASHTLLQRRSAPRKVVRLLPEKRGRLTVRILFFLGNKSFTVIPKRNSPLPSFLSGGQNRNDDRRKNIM